MGLYLFDRGLYANLLEIFLFNVKTCFYAMYKACLCDFTHFNFGMANFCPLERGYARVE